MKAVTQTLFSMIPHVASAEQSGRTPEAVGGMPVKIKLLMDLFSSISDTDLNSDEVDESLEKSQRVNLGAHEFPWSCKRSKLELAISKDNNNKQTKKHPPTTKRRSALPLSVPFADVATRQKRINPVLVVGQTARGCDASAFKKNRKKRKKRKRGSEKKTDQ